LKFLLEVGADMEVQDAVKIVTYKSLLHAKNWN